MPKRSFAQETVSWDQLAKAVARHAEQLPSLTSQAAELAEVVARLYKLSGRQKRLLSQLRIVTRELQEGQEDGRLLAGRLRSGVKQAFGFSAPKLLEFGTKPRRRKLRRRSGDVSEPDPSEVPS
jgi:hypothetical protein